MLKKNLIFRWSNGLRLEMFESCFPISEHSLRNVNVFFAGEVNIHAEIFIQILLNETKEAETI